MSRASGVGCKRGRSRGAILTAYDPPPIPLRQFDWSAVYENTDGHPVGYGATEAEAIAELKQMTEEE